MALSSRVVGLVGWIGILAATVAFSASADVDPCAALPEDSYTSQADPPQPGPLLDAMCDALCPPYAGAPMPSGARVPVPNGVGLGGALKYVDRWHHQCEQKVGNPERGTGFCNKETVCPPLTTKVSDGGVSKCQGPSINSSHQVVTGHPRAVCKAALERAARGTPLPQNPPASGAQAPVLGQRAGGLLAPGAGPVIAAGGEGQICRADLGCNSGLVCELGVCSTNGNAGRKCRISGLCNTPHLQCDEKGICVAGGDVKTRCHEGIGAAAYGACNEGLVCEEKVCVHVGGPHEPCRVRHRHFDEPPVGECDGDNVCVASKDGRARCEKGGEKGETCAKGDKCNDSHRPSLRCDVNRRCTEHVGERDKPCFLGNMCFRDLACDPHGICKHEGRRDERCKAGRTCDPGLHCENDLTCRGPRDSATGDPPCPDSPFWFCRKCAAEAPTSVMYGGCTSDDAKAKAENDATNCDHDDDKCPGQR